MRKLLAGIVLSVFGLGFGLVCLEIGFRLVEKRLQPVAWSDRPSAYFKPESSRGMQDYHFALPKPENTFRIAVIGDSFSFSPYMQFDDTFVKKLERILNLNADARKVEVINYGVPRYSTSHEIEATKQALSEQADLVLLQITLNDPQIKPYVPTGLIRGSTNSPKLEVSNTFLAWIFRHWHSAYFVAQRLHVYSSKAEYIKFHLDLFENKQTYTHFENSLSELVKHCRNSGIPVAGIIFPMFGLNLDKHYPFLGLHQNIAALLNKLDMPYLDLFKAYGDIPIDRLQVIPGVDYHPNELAHRIAAEHIYAWLARHRLIPPESVVRHQYATRISITPSQNDPIYGPGY